MSRQPIVNPPVPPIPSSPQPAVDRKSTGSNYPLASIGNMLTSDGGDDFDSDDDHHHTADISAKLKCRIAKTHHAQHKPAHTTGHDAERGVMSPVSDYSELDRAPSGVWVHSSGDTNAKGGDRRSVARQQVPSAYLQSIAGELDTASSDGRLSNGPPMNDTGLQNPMMDRVRDLAQETREQDDRERAEARIGDTGIMKRQGEERLESGKRITIVDFPTPSLGGGGGGGYQGHGDISGNGYQGRRYDQQPVYQHQQPTQQHPNHQPVDRYAYQQPSTMYPSPSHPGPFSSPHLVPHYHTHSPLPSSTSLPSLSAPYPGVLGSNGYARLAGSSPNLAPLALPHPGPITIDLPPPQSPISPMLAMPPSAVVSSPRHLNSALPSSNGSSPGPTTPSPLADSHSGNQGGGDYFHPPSTARLSISSTNASVRGFDLLKEKNALFRGGEEDLLGFSPRGPQARTRPGRSGLAKGRAASRLMTTVDFWKRMSVMRIQGEGGKESQWLTEAQGSRKGIKKWIIIGLVILVIVIGAGVAYAVYAAMNAPKSGIVASKDV